MRKFSLLYLIYLIVITVNLFAPSKTASDEMDKVELYFVDKRMMRLVKTDFYVTSSTAEDEVRMIVEELLRGRDEIETIRRFLPKEKDAVRASVDGETAIIDFNPKYLEYYEKGKLQEELIIYQIVNSVASVDGISRVKFRFGGKLLKSFLGEMDMREAFIPDYYV